MVVEGSPPRASSSRYLTRNSRHKSGLPPKISQTRIGAKRKAPEVADDNINKRSCIRERQSAITPGSAESIDVKLNVECGSDEGPDDNNLSDGSATRLGTEPLTEPPHTGNEQELLGNFQPQSAENISEPTEEDLREENIAAGRDTNETGDASALPPTPRNDCHPTPCNEWICYTCHFSLQ